MPLWHALHKSLPIMLALCSMLLPSYYAPNYAGIIGSGLVLVACNHYNTASDLGSISHKH